MHKNSPENSVSRDDEVAYMLNGLRVVQSRL